MKCFFSSPSSESYSDLRLVLCRRKSWKDLRVYWWILNRISRFVNGMNRKSRSFRKNLFFFFFAKDECDLDSDRTTSITPACPNGKSCFLHIDCDANELFHEKINGHFSLREPSNQPRSTLCQCCDESQAAVDLSQVTYTRFENEKVSRPLTAHRQAHMSR